MTVDNVTFQTNNIMGNFNYPPNVPAYKPIMKFLLNCPLNKAFTNCLSMLYQNYLREFSSTTVAYDPFPSTDETEQRSLREFLIKFSVLNGKRPLTLDFNTFCSSTGLDYNYGKYVDHLTPKVLGGNYSSTMQVNSIQQLLAYCLITRTEVDIGEIIYMLLGSNYTQDARFGYLPTILSSSNCKKDPSKVTDIELTAHMIAVNNQRDSVSPLPLSAKPKKGKSQTVTPTLPKLQGPEASRALSKKSKKPKSKKTPAETKGLPSHSLMALVKSLHFMPESTNTAPKDSVGNKQPIDRGLTSMDSDEGTAKTTPHPEGSLGDKDLGEETNHPLIWNQSTLLLLIFQALGLNVRAFLLSDDEAQESKEDILGAGEEMDEDPQATSIAETYHQSPPPQADKPQSSHAPSTKASDTDYSCDDILKKYDNTLPLTERQLVKYLRKVSTMLFDRITEDNREKHEEVVVNYANLKASIDECYDENIAHRDQTDKLVEASMSSLDKSSTTITNVEGENDTNTSTKDPLSHTKGETNANMQEKSKEPKHSTDTNIELIGSSKPQPSITQAQPITIINLEPIIPQRECKGISTDEQVKDQRKLVKASSIIHPDPDALIPYIINGEVYYLTAEQLQAHMDKKEKIKKAEEEARLK
ncbi:hypothetical protein Tco_1305727 [Tanacetum coccineum]